jgi:hypothetical protein
VALKLIQIPQQLLVFQDYLQLEKLLVELAGIVTGRGK